MIVEFHCECPNCGGTTVYPREMKYPGENPQVHVPFTLEGNSFKCAGCDIVWEISVALLNVSEYFPEADSDMPNIEGRLPSGNIDFQTKKKPPRHLSLATLEPEKK